MLIFVDTALSVLFFVTKHRLELLYFSSLWLQLMKLLAPVRVISLKIIFFVTANKDDNADSYGHVYCKTPLTVPHKL